MKVVLASQNRHKLAEIQAILAQYDMELVLQSDLGLQIDVDETGESFEENSELKARAVMEATGLPAVADDSGLCVDVLGGAPGIYSARYGAPDCVTDRDRLNHLLNNLRGVRSEERTARFVCVITLVWPDGRKLVARGSCEGLITSSPGARTASATTPSSTCPPRAAPSPRWARSAKTPSPTGPTPCAAWRRFSIRRMNNPAIGIRHQTRP